MEYYETMAYSPSDDGNVLRRLFTVVGEGDGDRQSQ